MSRGSTLNEVRTSTFSLVREVRIIEYTQDEGRAAPLSSPLLSTGDFPLRPLHLRKLNIFTMVGDGERKLYYILLYGGRVIR